MKRMTALLFVLLLCAAHRGMAADFTFAAFGDAPYSEAEETQFTGNIAAMNREPLAFAINVGDFKNGWSPCTDALFAQRLAWFEQSHHPLIYTPGDNEWTDCWRTSSAPSDPVERLQQLRRLFFAEGQSLGRRKIALERQNTEYPEHARWEHNGVVFATLNVPGDDNNARQPRESAARTTLVNAWITDTFRAARVKSLGAVVLAMQANPWPSSDSAKRAYGSIMETMTRETQYFDGEVLLIHGDSHRHRIDKPLIALHTRLPVPNFTRLEVFGSPQVNWVRVTVNRENDRIRFGATPGSP